MCGSACAHFTSQLRFYNKVKAVLTHGGILGQDLAISSFPGGDVLPWAQFTTLVNDSTIIAQFPTNAIANFNHHESYLGDSDTPCEFEKYTADYHIYMWDAIFNNNGLEKLYATTAKLFSNEPQLFSSSSQNYSSNNGPNYNNLSSGAITAIICSASLLPILIIAGYWYKKRAKTYKKLDNYEEFNMT